MKNVFCVFGICAVLFFGGTSRATAQAVATQPSPPLANAPFVAYVSLGNSFDSHAGFDLTTLRVEGNTVSVPFYLCLTLCSYVANDGPFPLPMPALPSGNYTLAVTLIGFSPTPPPEMFPFSVGAAAASPLRLPVLSTWGMFCLLIGLMLVASRAMRRCLSTRNRGLHG